jgi:hypothetical protein
MAEISLYLTESDELPIVTLALQPGCHLVPDLRYTAPKYKSLGTVERYKKIPGPHTRFLHCFWNVLTSSSGVASHRKREQNRVLHREC